eukprot:CAMPEP_0174238832 /NCGR_PEP_ID=MMETSP0417-20130205/12706_1 /TAXON_ID=242541 /ORGANISM="Mayorella sp, Strain BSH-02190019" /LENGTH=447 /DNA_ID=CAMNT_0015317719 /DNA_START=38 /DNA_END=1381 /DNA_ORIENTATION=+
MSVVATQEQELTLEEVAKHAHIGRDAKSSDLWLCYEGYVYDVSSWAFSHPGGRHIVAGWAGRDATVAIKSFHPNMTEPKRIMKSLRVGKLCAKDSVLPEIDEDVLNLRQKYLQHGLYKGNKLWFFAQFAHILFLDVMSWVIMYNFGTGWLSYIAAGCVLAAGQAQAGWLQHDFGHLSVFSNPQTNRWVHQIVVGVMKGASKTWWDWRHLRHHSHPNVVGRDPDVDMPQVFLLGDKVPVSWAKKKKGVMPYDQQHKYWFLIMPPLLIPTFFHYQILHYIIMKREWVDALAIATFLFIFHWAFIPLLGGSGAVIFYFFVRFLESHWFVWITQMNHLPMEVDVDKQRPWLAMQTIGTCNVTPTLFNNWVSGHLSSQIEHHVFPTLPRHNYHLVRDDVKDLCQKHNLPYVEKGLWQAFADIVWSLRDSGALWKKTYEETHGSATGKTLKVH